MKDQKIFYLLCAFIGLSIFLTIRTGWLAHEVYDMEDELSSCNTSWQMQSYMLEKNEKVIDSLITLTNRIKTDQNAN